MTKSVLIFFFICLSQLGFSQTNSLAGKWKAIAVNNGEVYYDFKTDSISILSDDLKEIYDDESKIKVLKQLMKKMYGSTNFEFQKEEVLKMELQPGLILESKYKNDVKRNIIVIQDKNALDQIVNDEMQYKFDDNKLYLNFDLTETPSLFIFEKVK